MLVKRTEIKHEHYSSTFTNNISLIYTGREEINLAINNLRSKINTMT